MHPEVMLGVRGGNLMMGHDPECKDWIKAYRDPNAVGVGSRGGRTGGRRRSS